MEPKSKNYTYKYFDVGIIIIIKKSIHPTYGGWAMFGTIQLIESSIGASSSIKIFFHWCLLYP